MTIRRNCRLWWPTYLFSQTPPNPSFVFGWFLHSSEASIDVVVAFACDQHKLASSLNSGLDLMEILRQTDENMPTVLQDKSELSLLGYLEADCSGNSKMGSCRNDRNEDMKRNGNQSSCSLLSSQENWRCGCIRDRILGQGRLAGPEHLYIKLVYVLSERMDGRVLAIPKMDHLHLNGDIDSHLDLHVIFYEIPTFGGHHYSLGAQFSSNPVETPSKKPKWFEDLHRRDSHLDLDTVIQAINSANAAQILFDGHQCAESRQLLFILHMFSTFAWQIFAASVASISTMIYIVLQSFRILFSWLSHTSIYVLFTKVFSNSSKNVHFRCCQLLYWPVFLQDQNMRDWSCVEFAEKAASHKHSIWSSIVFDSLLGTVLGIPLWFKAELAYIWVSDFSLDFTNGWLRTGCVWLMGNPAGFKLNTELAGVLGMISLNAIQIWSTLWASVGFLFIHFFKGLALCGILFGSTCAAALLVDIISLLTMHVLILHLFLSILYSTQIQALSALWRLFRGKKLNPLRHRLDSYDYTVEQHVVGSLLFTPILLLLPTTSAFYIFFTILHTAVCFVSIAVGAIMSFIRSTPYAKVFLWLKMRKRFPSGIFLKVALCQHSETEAFAGSNLSTVDLHKTASSSGSSCKSTILVTFLDSNYLKLGEVVWPHYKNLYSAFSRSAICSSAYGLLTGRSTLHAPAASLPMTLPWIVIPWKEYWHLCRNSVYACRKHPYRNPLTH
ncbi:N-acetylglucosaminyl-phosphatidylinositol biosynthetic protein gpi1-like isoform X1 [Salvia splendens]|uniref:N-acetylglucosaminyl-phosphatidylinositol biosynthetic protein gpi1-like isoform X1 n=1 Tax=Salvia splendens TaxID=180675 RepID=UPI001C26ADC2|nr:N-acetylglucosaminyl-phosphatidylinositol biosynthetic protein gpi1-like isoform X1 [Salvia splendens]